MSSAVPTRGSYLSSMCKVMGTKQSYAIRRGWLYVVITISMFALKRSLRLISDIYEKQATVREFDAVSLPGRFDSLPQKNQN